MSFRILFGVEKACQQVGVVKLLPPLLSELEGLCAGAYPRERQGLAGARQVFRQRRGRHLLGVAALAGRATRQGAEGQGRLRRAVRVAYPPRLWWEAPLCRLQRAGMPV